ncbi:MAG: aldo/keto reductase [Planctomycetota bacterium]|nr:aldo/keto reductase [Planctomycetota bacterium]
MSPSARTVTLDGVTVPRFLYGTAWKEVQTAGLVELALQQGFAGIDTANQRKHYDEAAVGRAVAAACRAAVLERSALFLQTKFTFRGGQDERLPYDPEAPIAAQVAQSFALSLEHLGVSTIDSYLLHGPTSSVGLTADDWEAWAAMESLHEGGRVRLIGVSNFSLEQLQMLSAAARVPPRFVQNRCYATTGWDRNIRHFCQQNQMCYQGFSLLTANRPVLRSPAVQQIAERHTRTPAQIVFRFALDVGMIPLTGTTDAEHMKADLDVFDFQLQPEEITKIERIACS